MYIDTHVDMGKIFRGDIYIANMNLSAGARMGIRPVLILSNNVTNRYRNTVIIASISSRWKPNYPTNVVIKDVGLTRESAVILNSIYTIDKRRLAEYVSTLDSATMELVDRGLGSSIGLETLNANLGTCVRDKYFVLSAGAEIGVPIIADTRDGARNIMKSCLINAMGGTDLNILDKYKKGTDYDWGWEKDTAWFKHESGVYYWSIKKYTDIALRSEYMRETVLKKRV